MIGNSHATHCICDYCNLPKPNGDKMTAIPPFQFVSVPHKCPVCEGRGTVPCNFYEPLRYTTTSTAPIECKSCDGKAIIWR